MNMEFIIIISGALLLAQVQWAVVCSGAHPAGTGNLVGSKIRDGQRIDYDTDYTFTVNIGIRYKVPGIFEYTRCSGSVIQSEWVLSAAHCFERYTSISVGLKSGLNDAMSVEAVFMHPLYDNATLQYDFALLRLRDTQTVRPPISLYSGKLRDLIAKQPECFLTAYGRVEPFEYTVIGYRKLDLKLKGDRKCSRIANYDGTQHFCYQGKPFGSACEGDVGGPITCLVEGNLTQIGVNLAADCSNVTMMAADVTLVNPDWVQQILTANSYPRCPLFPKFRHGGFAPLNRTVWHLRCDEGYEPEPSFPEVFCLSAGQQDSKVGQWSDYSQYKCRRKRCQTSGTSFMVAFIYEDNWAGRYPAISILPTSLTQVNIKIPLLDFEGYYLFDHHVSFTFSKSIYGSSTETVSPLGILITSDKPMKVLMYQYSRFGLLGEGSLVLPLSCAAKTYTIFRLPFKAYRTSQNIVVALADNTTVRIINRRKDTISTTTLQRFYGLRDTTTDDFYNRYLIADKDVVVFKGHECTNSFDRVRDCGYLMEQVVPDPVLGQQYILPKFRPVTAIKYSVQYSFPTSPVPPEEHNTYTVPVSNPGTDLTTLNDTLFSDIDDVIQCEVPCIVSAYSYDWQNSFHHVPVGVTLTAVDQWERSYDFLAGQDGGWLTLTIHDKYGIAGLRFNGVELETYLGANTTVYSSYAVLPNTGNFTSLNFPIPPGKTSVAHEKRRASFGLLYYGFYENEFAYAFQLGRRV